VNTPYDCDYIFFLKIYNSIYIIAFDDIFFYHRNFKGEKQVEN